MTFDEVLEQALEMLRRRGRVSYRALKVQFELDDTLLEILKDEIVEVHQLARDQEGKMLVWTGDAASPGVPAPIRAPDQGPAPLTCTPPYLAEKILTSRSALEGERKQVTVLFADIKDSTELIRDLDPEAAQQLLDPALHRMMEAVHRFEGTVNQVLGDGIMALFGAPLAHEDHALRACYAALTMQTAMREYMEAVRHTHGLELHIRVGLNAGEVVVRSIGNDLHMDYSAVGQTTHLAARMEQLATPGAVRLTAATLRLVEGLVQVQELGPIPVKGMTEPVEVFELLGASALGRRLQAGVARGLTRFVGREGELAALRQALEQASSGHGQVVAVETQPELLAHHCTEAGLAAQAVGYWQQAGERCTTRSAYVEAAAHLTKGLEALQTLPDTPERAQREVDMQIALGLALQVTKGFAALEVGDAYTRARELCQQVGDTPQLAGVLRGLGMFYRSRGELQTARELGEQLLTLAQRQHDPDSLAYAHWALGEVIFYLGEFTPARAHLD
jgi:class 3 adenylate cyclase